MNRSKGFTLIELLVVIAIIGLLASIILASLNTAQQKGRDARRIADMKEVQLALELYYDANSTYPVQGTALTAPQYTSSNLPSVLAPTYISQLPTDPSQPSGGASSNFYYQYESLASDGTSACGTTPCPGYVLVAHLEAGANSSTWTSATSPWSTVCPSGGGNSSPYSYCVHN